MFRDCYVLCIYVMNILCTFHIFMYGYVTDGRDCCNPSKTSSTIWLLYCDQLHLHFSHHKYGCFCGVRSHFQLVKHTRFRIRLHSPFITPAFKSCIEWSNAQRVIAPTTTILSTWYTRSNLARTIILLNFWLILVISLLLNEKNASCRTFHSQHVGINFGLVYFWPYL